MENKNEKVNESTHPDTNKPYVFRNFVKEIKRVTWPTKRKNYRYFFWTFVFIIFLIAFFALLTFGATEILKLIGAN